MLPVNWQWAFSKFLTGSVSNYCWLEWHLLVRQRSTRVHSGTNSQEATGCSIELCWPCLLHVKNRGKHWGQSLQVRPGSSLASTIPHCVFWGKLMTLGLRILSHKIWQTSGALYHTETPYPITEDTNFIPFFKAPCYFTSPTLIETCLQFHYPLYVQYLIHNLGCNDLSICS